MIPAPVLLFQLFLALPLAGGSNSHEAFTAPLGWTFAAFERPDYRYGCDSITYHAGKRSGFFQYAVDPMVVHPRRGPAAFFQAFKAGQFKGKRIRVTAYVKAAGNHGGAFLWRNLEERHRLSAYAFPGEPISANTDWERHVIVIEVPPTTEAIVFGVTLSGRGTIWVDDVAIDTVQDGPVTGALGHGLPTRAGEAGVKTYLEMPTNLDFEK
jgi:hypothetical protein